jgi:hypothetical protein
MTKPKPLPVGDIVNGAAAARHSDALESRREGLSVAGARLRRWFCDAGATVTCPEAR